MEEVKVTNLWLVHKKGRVTRYSLKIDGEHYYYEIVEEQIHGKVRFAPGIFSPAKTELIPLKAMHKFSCIEGAIIPMDITNPQKTIEQFYKTLMLQ